jgi:hypothetical protein
MELLIKQFSPTSHHLISLFGPNILLNTVLSNTLSPCLSLKVRDYVSHSYRTTGKIIVVYLMNFMFLDCRREDERSWTTKLNVILYLPLFLYSLKSISIVNVTHTILKKKQL